MIRVRATATVEFGVAFARQGRGFNPTERTTAVPTQAFVIKKREKKGQKKVAIVPKYMIATGLT